MRDRKRLIIYGVAATGLNAQAAYAEQYDDFDTILHREAQFFERPEKCDAFAIEAFHTDTILRIRNAYGRVGIPEVARAGHEDLRGGFNKPESDQVGGDEREPAGSIDAPPEEGSDEQKPQPPEEQPTTLDEVAAARSGKRRR